jgi:hypothetical protein
MGVKRPLGEPGRRRLFLRQRWKRLGCVVVKAAGFAPVIIRFASFEVNLRAENRAAARRRSACGSNRFRFWRCYWSSVAGRTLKPLQRSAPAAVGLFQAKLGHGSAALKRDGSAVRQLPNPFGDHSGTERRVGQRRDKNTDEDLAGSAVRGTWRCLGDSRRICQDEKCCQET